MNRIAHPNTVPFYLHKIAEEYANKTALIVFYQYRKRVFTFKTLYLAIQKTVRFLAGESIKKGDRVLICADNAAETLIMLLACGCLGAVSIPVDVNTTEAILHRLVKRSNPKLIVTSRMDIMESTVLDCRRYPVLCLFDDLRKVPDPTQDDLPVYIDETDLLHLFYTSGTTGNPKGVRLTHRNLISNVQNFSLIEDLDRGDTILSMAPLSHAMGLTMGLLIPWYFGNTIMLSTNLTPTKMVHLLQTQPVNSIVTVPVFLDRARDRIEQRLNERGVLDRIQKLQHRAFNLPSGIRRMLFRRILKAIAPSLQWVAVGGSAVNPDTEWFWEALGIKIVNGYGLTETLIASCSSFSLRHMRSVGLGIPNQHHYIDSSGEIWLAGSNVMEGYDGEPELNAQVFQNGWFRTGDLGYEDEAGHIYITGRAKNVIIGPSGINIYPEDIELILRRQLHVTDSLVVESPVTPGLLWGLVLLDEEPNEDMMEAIRTGVNQQVSSHQHLQKVLPWFEEDFPRTGALKIKRNAVYEQLDHYLDSNTSSPSTNQPEETTDISHPTSPTIEKTRFINLLASITKNHPSEITGSEHLGADLNLDSLGLMDLLSGIEESFQQSLPTQALFNTDYTVNEVYELLQQDTPLEITETNESYRENLLARLFRVAIRPLIVWLFRLGFPIQIEGKKHLPYLEQEPFLIIANHQSHLDWMSIWAALPRRIRRRLSPAAAYDYFYKGKSGFRKFWFHTLAYFLPWRRDANPEHMLKETAGRINEGYHILLFPEGTRSRDGTLGEFKPTLGKLVKELQLPVLPVRISGTYKLWGPDKRFPKLGRIQIEWLRPRFFSCSDEPHTIRDQLQQVYELETKQP